MYVLQRIAVPLRKHLSFQAALLQCGSQGRSVRGKPRWCGLWSFSCGCRLQSVSCGCGLWSFSDGGRLWSFSDWRRLWIVRRCGVCRVGLTNRQSQTRQKNCKQTDPAHSDVSPKCRGIKASPRRTRASCHRCASTLIGSSRRAPAPQVTSKEMISRTADYASTSPVQFPSGAFRQKHPLD